MKVKLKWLSSNGMKVKLEWWGLQRSKNQIERKAVKPYFFTPTPRWMKFAT